jgi:hypothetical protein
MNILGIVDARERKNLIHFHGDDARRAIFASPFYFLCKKEQKYKILLILLFRICD